ncbi:MAG: hypothetical protein UY23_C0001G0207 [Candidatus Jorgensenbacteria bacterium GW2011_GWA1_48_11]|uniref:Uncharacterized protein n=1 Tax=Candidatus Jorgensenbacteria bacterium GW2011_GWA1_48_11 TaxID=1618660 RepID=A0A0G1UBT2_9BACT|nr:MAG: hypothetical protein UY23_C0001G0207 [Candidatus Jorgensenbacteria bacterium GW2011_GWA1_48_11]KKW12093.1 MAG: hypothetical protein UY51_C0005G0335 [Candidatus Jorgensenbacteria bacterium GW2011_GWB1_49_9]
MAAKIFLSLALVTSAVFFLAPNPASAQVLNIWQGTSGGGCNLAGNGPCNLCDALIVASNIIQYLWYISTSIATAMIVYGALRLMIAGGSEDAVQKSKSIMTNAVLGLIIALAAWAIVNTILHLLAGSLNFPWNQIQCTS